PLAVVAVIITVRHLPVDAPQPRTRIDVLSTISVVVGLAALTYVLIEGRDGWAWPVLTIVGIAGIGVFTWSVRARSDPLVDPRVFSSARFNAVNLTTLFVYAALGGGTFLLTLQLQQSLNYSALAAGAATVPMTLIMLVGSPIMGRVTDQIGPRIPMTVGSLIAGAGMALAAFITPGVGFTTAVLPAVVTFGVGLTLVVTPLTTAMLASVHPGDAGAASGVNNAVSRVAGLLAVAVLPPLAGITAGPGEPLGAGFTTAMLTCAGLCAVGSAVSWVGVKA
ncbi:MAG TPA: MFS transporter, partial [Beutenbergiaceae bacterium]|nr:MFS transporter [Beutenbergiaceae bacterium]